jgi:hypothetical protein
MLNLVPLYGVPGIPEFPRGNRPTVSLNDVGLIEQFKTRISADIAAFEESVITAAKTLAREMLSKGQYEDSKTIPGSIPYDFAPGGTVGFLKGVANLDPLVVLGNGSVKAVATIRVKRLHDGTKWLNAAKWDAEISYSVDDPFEDVCDINNKKPGNQDLPGSTAYRITGYWESHLEGTVTPHSSGTGCSW